MKNNNSKTSGKAGVANKKVAQSGVKKKSPSAMIDFTKKKSISLK